MGPVKLFRWLTNFGTSFVMLCCIRSSLLMFLAKIIWIPNWNTIIIPNVDECKFCTIKGIVF